MKKIKFILLIPFINYGYSEIINISNFESSYINLNKNNKENYFYFVDYNQKDSGIYKFIKDDLIKLNKNINVRYVPIATGNKNLCFNHKESDYYFLKNNNCLENQKIPTYFYNNESDLPLIFFSDGSTVKVATKVSAKLINEYFNLLNEDKLKLIESKNNLVFKNILMYQKKYSDRNKFNKYYNDNKYYSYYCFGKYIIKKQIIETKKSSSVNFVKENNFKESVNLNKKLKKQQLQTLKTKNLDYKNNYFTINNYSSNNYFYKIYKNMSLSNNIFNIYTESVNIEEEKEAAKIQKNINTKSLKLKTKLKTKLLKKEVLDSGITVYEFSKPNITKVNIKWGKVKPEKAEILNTNPISDPDIQIINNIK